MPTDLSEPIRNYAVCVSQFGAYPRGSVLPEYVIAAAGDVAEMVRREIVHPTNDAVNVAVVAPPAKADADPGVSVEAIDAERERADAAERDRDTHAAHAADWKRRHAALEAELAKYVGEVDRLKGHLTAEQDAHGQTKAELTAANDLLAEPKAADPKPE